jgi:hypothetical protein
MLLQSGSRIIETCGVRNWGKTKGGGGGPQAVVASHARWLPSPSCPHSVNIFQASRYVNWTVEFSDEKKKAIIENYQTEILYKILSFCGNYVKLKALKLCWWIAVRMEMESSISDLIRSVKVQLVFNIWRCHVPVIRVLMTGIANDDCLHTHHRPQCHVQSMDQGANSGCTQVVSLTHVPLFLICKACDIVEEPLQLWTNGICVHIQ